MLVLLVLQYLNNHRKFQKWLKNKEHHDFTVFTCTAIPMAADDALEFYA